MPVVSFVNPDSVHNPTAGGTPTAAWLTTLEADYRSLRGRPGAIIRATASQSFPSGSTSQVTLGTVVASNGSYTGTANQITIPAGLAGKYLISTQARVDTFPIGPNYVQFDVYLNAVTMLLTEIDDRSGASGSVSGVSGSIIAVLAVSDNLRLFVTPSFNATSADSEVSNIYPTLSAFWLAP